MAIILTAFLTLSRHFLDDHSCHHQQRHQENNRKVLHCYSNKHNAVITNNQLHLCTLYTLSAKRLVCFVGAIILSTANHCSLFLPRDATQSAVMRQYIVCPSV